jgi:outer membrane protein
MNLKSLSRPATTLLISTLAALILTTAAPRQVRGQAQFTSPATALDYTRSHAFPDIFRPYGTPFVPQPNMKNSERLHSLIRDGKLRLSLEDAIALALENGLDIEVSRYQQAYAQTDILRTRAGSTSQGINPGLFGAVTSFGGGGFGGGGGGGTSSGGFSGGGSASSVPTVGCCDPVTGISIGWDQRTTPLNSLVLQGVPVVGVQTTNANWFIGKGYFTGTSLVAFVNGFRSSNTSTFNLFNPEVPTTMTLGFTQHLLNGFGYRANAKFLRIAQNGVKQADTTFRQTVMTSVTNVVNLYDGLLYDRENVRVAQDAVTYSQKLLEDNKRQVQIGTLAPIEVVRAESEVATDQQNLIIAQTIYQQQQEQLKTAISKQVDPELAAAQIETTDALPEPTPGDIPTLEEALNIAYSHRPELTLRDLDIRNQRITIEASRVGLLPTLDLFGTYAPSGLSGNRLTCPSGSTLNFGTLQCTGGGVTTTPTVSSNGFFSSIGQVFRNVYPDYAFGISFSVPLRNRQSQANMATAQLLERQLRTQYQQQKNTITQDVKNAEIAVIQAKAQINAAQKATILARQTLEAEQKKFQLGESTVFMIIQDQRDLTAREGDEAKARQAYSTALTQYGTATGSTLDRFHIELAEAKSGHVNHVPNIPGTPASGDH